MSSDIITLKLTERKELGKAAKALRRQGVVPTNMYERGKESQALSADFVALTKVYHQAGKHNPVVLDVDGVKHLAMIKDVDVDPVKGTIRHIAFHAVNKNETVEAEIPVRIEGEVPALKLSLLVLQNLDTVIVEALPGNLPSELFVPGSMLVNDGDKVTVADIMPIKNVTVLSDPETMVADVQVPKDQIAEADAALEDDKAAGDVEAEKGTDETKAEDSAE